MSLDALDLAIIDILKTWSRGKDNARTSPKLVENIKARSWAWEDIDDRALRLAISRLVREEGLPICSGSVGFWWAETQEECDEAIANDLSRVRALLERVNGLRQGARSLGAPGQLELELDRGDR